MASESNTNVFVGAIFGSRYELTFDPLHRLNVTSGPWWMRTVSQGSFEDAHLNFVTEMLRKQSGLCAELCAESCEMLKARARIDLPALVSGVSV